MSDLLSPETRDAAAACCARHGTGIAQALEEPRTSWKFWSTRTAGCGSTAMVPGAPTPA